MPLPGSPEVGDAASTKKQIFEVKQAETLPNEDSPAATHAILGEKYSRKNNKEAAAEPQKMEFLGCQCGHNIRMETRVTAAVPHKNRGIQVANAAVIE
jgi:hypothetical protein